MADCQGLQDHDLYSDLTLILCHNINLHNINKLKVGDIVTHVETERDQKKAIDNLLSKLYDTNPGIFGGIQELFMEIPHTHLYHRYVDHDKIIPANKTHPINITYVYGTCVICGLNYGGDPLEDKEGKVIKTFEEAIN